MATLLAVPALAQNTLGDSAFSTPAQEVAPGEPFGPELPADAQTQRLQQEELEAKLIGAWAFIATTDVQMTNAMVEESIKRCLKPLALKSLNIETGAARALPDPKDMFGDIVYYRTLKGLQRLSLKTGQIIRLPKSARKQLADGTIVWGVAGRAATFRIRFANPSQTRRVEFMLEENGVYLRCQLKPEAAAASQ